MSHDGTDEPALCVTYFTACCLKKNWALPCRLLAYSAFHMAPGLVLLVPPMARLWGRQPDRLANVRSPSGRSPKIEHRTALTM